APWGRGRTSGGCSRRRRAADATAGRDRITLDIVTDVALASHVSLPNRVGGITAPSGGAARSVDMSAPRTLDASDHVAIAELLTRWTRCLDSADLEGFVELFEPGGVVHDSSDRHAGPVSLAAREYALRRYGEEGFPG